MRSRKRWRIENDRVELLAFSLQPRQDGHDVIGNKSMIRSRHGVEREIFAAARERLFRKIDVHRHRAHRCRGNRKRTRVRETVEESLRREIADEPSIFSLIDEETDGISRAEIDCVTELPLESGALEVRVRIAENQPGRFALGTLFRKKTREDPAEGEIDIECPEAELGLQLFEGGRRFVRDEDVDTVALDPSIWRRAKPQCGGLLRDEIQVDFWVDPFGHSHGAGRRQSLVTTSFGFGCPSVRLLPVQARRLQWRGCGSTESALPIMRQVTVRVPASTSNLGPGFDCLGVARRIYNEVTLCRGRGEPLPRMIRDAGEAFFKRAAVRPFAFSGSVAGQIPPSRGLGSSAAIRLGVLDGLNQLAERPLQRRELFEIGAELEGHPDNAAPACYGGFNVVRGLERQMFTVGAQLHFILLIPHFEVATAKARALLPARIDRLQAVENSRNACAITAAFASREYAALRGAFADNLHQPFRKKLIPFLDDVINAAESAGALGAFLTGSGSIID